MPHLSIASGTEMDHSVWQAVLASFAKAQFKLAPSTCNDG